VKNSIAIVGIDCRYPGANTPNEYWENIMSLRQQFRNIPKKRLDLQFYGSDDRSNYDSTYVKKAAVLTDYNFDRIKYRISKSTFKQTDLAHWLALDVAAGVLKDAGFENGDGLPKDRVGVVIGNSLNGEFSRANLMRLRWPYVYKVFEASLKSHGLEEYEIKKILDQTEKTYKQPFPVPDSDMLAGGLSNTIAGRICNYFDFNGGGYTVDGACSSSLLALSNGCNSIVNGDIDIALVGGVDLSIDPFEMIGFARNGALAPNEMQVFGSKSEGFWPGEGCGMIMIMKEEEAVKRGLDIYALIKGWGISSDGKGGVTRPKSSTQQLAIQRAYEMADYSVSEVSLFEAHGTGTKIGDEIELTALVDELKKHKINEPTVVGSVKHLIGHTKAAAGIAGIIKSALALKKRVVPASLDSSGGHPIFQKNSSLIKTVHNPASYNKSYPFRSGVSSFGFGGINVHVTLEEPVGNTSFDENFDVYVKNNFDVEIFPFCSTSKENLIQKLEEVKRIVSDISRAEFIDLSNTLTSDFKYKGLYKASIVAPSADQLGENLSILINHLAKGEKVLFDSEKGVYFNMTNKPESISFLFPGQGSPVYKGVTFGKFKPLLNASSSLKVGEVSYDDNDKIDTSIAQSEIVKNSIQAIDLVKNLGIEANYGIGHSLGEIAALSWSNVISQETALKIAEKRGYCMSTYGETGGAMLALSCTEKVLNEIISVNDVYVTGYNGGGNYVVGGPEKAISKVEEFAFENQVKCTRLKVSHAFHTPMMSKAAEKFSSELNHFEFGKPKRPIISTVFGSALEGDIDFKEYLFKQIEKPVKFTQAIELVKRESTLFIELGPGKALYKTLQNDNSINIVSIDYNGNSFKGLFDVMSAAFVFGSKVKFNTLSSLRYYKKFDIKDWKLNVIENPCEQVDIENSNYTNDQSLTTILVNNSLANEIKEVESDHKSINTLSGVKDFIKGVISEKTEIPLEVISENDRVSTQLNLNSLIITEIISLTTKAYNKSHEVFSKASILANADGTIADLSEVIFNGKEGQSKMNEPKSFDFSDVNSWSHVFKRLNVSKRKSKLLNNGKPGEILVEGTREGLIERVKRALESERLPIGNGGVFVYQSDDNPETLSNFLSFLKRDDILKSDFILLLEIKKDKSQIDLKPVFRSFVQEYGLQKSSCLEISNNIENKSKILLDELKTISKYKEIVYEDEDNRTESQCQVFFPKQRDIKLSLTNQDVILATGGGKGITFESVLHLAAKTKAKVVIFGRSRLESDEVLKTNLLKLEEAGVDFKYYSVDVKSSNNIKETLDQVYKDFGKISVILHGAGINVPKTIANLNIEDFKNTLSVKVDGLSNIIDSIDKAQLRYVVGYGSIIAQSGMQGNADYAFANDQLAIYINDLGQELSNCKCYTLEWSVWDETGMGANLNSIAKLKEQGVYPISVKRGVEILENILADNECSSGRYIISGRYGSIPTLTFNKRKLYQGRFVNVVHQTPFVELVSDVAVNLNDDIFLKNHVFNGQYLFPTVMILEGMAQCCSSLSEKQVESWSFENLVINQSIFVPKEGVNNVRFIVTRLSKGEFKAIVRSEDSNFEVNCFEANVLIQKDEDSYQDLSSIEELKPLSLDTDKKFYDDLLFHTGGFRRIKSFSKINSLESIGKASMILDDNWFGPLMSEIKVLGDPGVNDAAIHCHQTCRPAQQLLPTHVDKIVFCNTSNIGNQDLFIQTNELKEEGGETTIDVLVFSEDGKVVQSWEGLILTKVKGIKRDIVWTPELIAPYMEYEIFHACGLRMDISVKDCREALENAKNNNPTILKIDEDHSLQVSCEGTTFEKSSNSVLFNEELKMDGINQLHFQIIKKIKEVQILN